MRANFFNIVLFWWEFGGELINWNISFVQPEVLEGLEVEGESEKESVVIILFNGKILRRIFS